jgi:hypothetical protein
LLSHRSSLANVAAYEPQLRLRIEFGFVTPLADVVFLLYSCFVVIISTPVATLLFLDFWNWGARCCDTICGSLPSEWGDEQRHKRIAS